MPRRTAPYGPGFGPERRWFSARAHTLVPSFGSVESAAVPVLGRARSTLALHGERTTSRAPTFTVLSCVLECSPSGLQRTPPARREEPVVA